MFNVLINVCVALSQAGKQHEAIGILEQLANNAVLEDRYVCTCIRIICSLIVSLTQPYYTYRHSHTLLLLAELPAPRAYLSVNVSWKWRLSSTANSTVSFEF